MKNLFTGMKKIVLSLLIVLAAIATVQAQKIYYTTARGGANGGGTLMRWNAAQPTAATVVYSFTTNGSQAFGWEPNGFPVVGNNGLMYFCVRQGSTYGYGGLLSLDTNSNSLSLVHAFTSVEGRPLYKAITEGGDGNLYLFTEAEHVNLVRVTKAGEFAFLSNNDPNTNGIGTPLNELSWGPDGKLYGTGFEGKTNTGGGDGFGEIFRIDPVTRVYETLYRFYTMATPKPPSLPSTGVLWASDGKLYGLFQKGDGGTGADYGGYYCFDPLTSEFKVLHSFQNEGGNPQFSYPRGPLVEGSDGRIYGVTGESSDVAVDGRLHSINKDGSPAAFQVHHTFVNSQTSPSGLFNPLQLFPGSDGLVWGLASNGGANLLGGLFSYDPVTKVFNERFSAPQNQGLLIGDIGAIDVSTASKRSITPIPTPLCPGNPTSVRFLTQGAFNNGNVFTLQLSNSAGSFASPTVLGTVTSIKNGTLNFTVPSTIPPALSGYKLRVVSSSPAVTSAEVAFKVPPGITINSPADVNGCVGTTLNLLQLPFNPSGNSTLSFYLDSMYKTPVPTPTAVGGGTYYVKAVSNDGCIDTTSVKYNIIGVRIDSLSVTPLSCPNNGGSVVFHTTSTGGATLQYALGNSNNTTGIFTNVPAGTFDASVRPGKGNLNCPVVPYGSPVLLSPLAQPAISGTGNITTTNANGLCSAIVTYSPTVTGTAPITVTYTFSGATTGSGSGTGSGSSFNAGTTIVTITASNGCVPAATSSFNVIVQDKTVPVVNCPGAVQFCKSANGQYTIAAATFSDNCSVQSVAYAITGATTRSGTTANASGVFNPGVSTITWTVTDAAGNTNGCSTTVTINDVAIAGVSVTQPTCTIATGAITISASGAGVLEYSVDNGATWSASNTFTGLAAGSYTVGARIKANPSCITYYGSNPVVLNEPGIPPTVTMGDVVIKNSDPYTCTAIVEYQPIITGNPSEVSYSFGNGFLPGTGSGFELPVNEVINAAIAVKNACGTDTAYFTIMALDTIRPAITSRPPIQFCNTDGNIHKLFTPGVTDCNGLASFEYVITGATNRSGDNQIATGEFNPGVSYVHWTIKDYAGNAAVWVDTVTVNTITLAGVDIVQPVACQTSTGSITINAGVPGTILYSIDGGTTWYENNSFSNLAPGSYTVSVRYAADPTCITNYAGNPVVINPAGACCIAPVITGVTPTQPTCTLATGSIVINATSAEVLEYSIDGGTTWSDNNTFTGLATGSYTISVRIKASPTCATVYSSNPVVLTTPTNCCIQPTIGTITAINTTTGSGLCSAVVNYNATINGSAGTVTYNFSGATTGSGNGTGSGAIFNTGVTTVTITVTNSCGTATTSFTVTVRDTENPSISCGTAQTFCSSGSGNYTIALPVTSDNCGVAGVTFAVTGATTRSGSTDASGVFNPGVSTITWTVTDLNGNINTCESTVTVNAASVTSVNAVQPTCTQATGSITITGSGTGAVEYSIDNGTSWSATNTFSTLSAGTYNVLVRLQSSPSCTGSYSGNPVVLSAATGCCIAPVITSVTSLQPTCAVPTGSITINATSAEVLEYSVNGTTWFASNTFTGLAAGTYTARVRVKASPTCATTATTPVVLTAATGCCAAPTLTVPANITTNAASGKCSATVTYTTSSSSTSLTYSFSGATTGSGTGNGSGKSFNGGITTVTITANSSCGSTKTGSFTITVLDKQAPVISSSGTTTVCKDASNTYTIPALSTSDNCGVTSITYTITGATSRSGSGSNASGVFNAGTSTITWTVKDAAGNTTTGTTSVKVGDPATVTITAVPGGLFCNKLILSVGGVSVSGDAIKWYYGSNKVGDGSTLRLGLGDASGQYRVEVSNNGCTSTAVYNYDPQTQYTNYSVIGLNSVTMGNYNLVISGSVGVTSSTGTASFGQYTVVPGVQLGGNWAAFVKAPVITAASTAVIPNRYIGAANISIPAALQNNTTPSGSNYTVTSNWTQGNTRYKNITVNAGKTATLTDTIYGTITINQGANVIFTRNSVNVEKLVLADGTSKNVTKVSFKGTTNVKVSSAVQAGSYCFINPENYNVTMYVASSSSTAKTFTVTGGANTWIDGNIYIPTGSISVTGSTLTARCTILGTVIAQTVVSGSNVTWGNIGCGNSSNNSRTMGDAITTADPVINNVFDVKAYANPTRAGDFQLYITTDNTNEAIRVTLHDISGRLLTKVSNAQPNSITRISNAGLLNGTYIAEVTQGDRKKVVKLVLLH